MVGAVAMEGFFSMTIKVELDALIAQRLQEVARRLNVSVNELATAAINNLLSNSESEADFERATARVLSKNAELYRRLEKNDR